jgi:HK97 family phage prohead protease
MLHIDNCGEKNDILRCRIGPPTVDAGETPSGPRPSIGFTLSSRSLESGFGDGERMPILLKRDDSLRLLPPLAVKRASAAGEITGYGSVFGTVDSYGDIIVPGAFSRTIAEHAAAGTMPVMLWAHDPAEPIGRWVDMREDATGLWMAGKLNLDSAAGKEAYSHLRAGDVSGLSIGFRVFPDGLEFDHDGHAVLSAIKLFEVSVVALPANPAARVTSTKHLKTRSDLIDALRQIGIPKAAARAVAAKGWAGIADGDDRAEAIAAARQALGASTRKWSDQ